MTPSRRSLLRAATAGGLIGIAGCSSPNNGGGYSSVDPTETERPVTGEFVESLVAFDKAILSFMNEQGVPGGVLGVAREGEILLQRGYGYRDADRSEPMTPETKLRIASLSKAFTRALVRELVWAHDELSLHSRVFPRLDLDPLPGETYNQQLDSITVQHLLDHQAGWDREAVGDPVFAQLDLALQQGWEEPPNDRQLVRSMLGKPLQFDPGTRYVYSNVGYVVLGLFVEAVTGTSYQDELETEILSPLGISGIEPGRSLPADRPGEETWYFDGQACRNTYQVRPHELVRCPDGGFHLESTLASGGHITTVPALLGFMSEYWLRGRRRTDKRVIRIHNGTLPGTYAKAIQYDAVDLVVLFNRRGYDPNYNERGLRESLLSTIEGIDSWGG